MNSDKKREERGFICFLLQVKTPQRVVVGFNDPLLWHFPQGISSVRFVMFLEDLNIKKIITS